MTLDFYNEGELEARFGTSGGFLFGFEVSLCIPKLAQESRINPPSGVLIRPLDLLLWKTAAWNQS